MKNNTSMDLNLLRIFLVIGEEKNLSRAAERLRLSQPGLSHALKRLREEFQDPLFVRAARGLVATPRAEVLLPEVRRALAQVGLLYATPASLSDAQDFSKLRRRFILGATTYFEIRILGSLLQRLKREAPEVTLETHSLVEGFPKTELEDGRMDLAVAAYFDQLPEGFRIRSLGQDLHVCVMRKNHPLAKKKLSLEDYLLATHVKIAVPPGKMSAVDRVLASRKKERRIVAHLANFVTPALAVKESDHLLTYPESLAKSYEKYFGLTWTKLPIAVPPIEIKMAWHERTHADPFHKMMRDAIAAAAGVGRNRGF